ncbi:Uncharacterised protein [Mycobacteroides abscessus subsp. bolletii]|nr:Uncharacterised protein [Mycobacteroides abscessus subsp. bolletii]SKH48304.1 Uncharacterised protein [Mycobacteroides abscessus subsp. bolletii]
MNARTTRVSNNKPIPMVEPNCPMVTRSLTTMDNMVNAKTSPAEVTTLPVPPIARMMPVLIPAPSSSFIRDTNSRL